MLKTHSRLDGLFDYMIIIWNLKIFAAFPTIANHIYSLCRHFFNTAEDHFPGKSATDVNKKALGATCNLKITH